MNARNRAEIYRRLRDANPNPRTELRYKSTFELLVAVILSAQATDVSVNKATGKLYKVAKTPRTIAALKESGLKQYIKTIGLYNTKAKNIIGTCKILLEKYGGEVPRTRAELEALPGVGRKTANIILNTVFGEATIAVDTHIFGSATVPVWRREKRRSKSRKNYLREPPKNSKEMRTTGSFSTDVTSARLVSQSARNASSRIFASTMPKR